MKENLTTLFKIRELQESVDYVSRKYYGAIGLEYEGDFTEEQPLKFKLNLCGNNYEDTDKVRKHAKVLLVLTDVVDYLNELELQMILSVGDSETEERKKLFRGDFALTVGALQMTADRHEHREYADTWGDLKNILYNYLVCPSKED